jgi:hypothetical protein
LSKYSIASIISILVECSKIGIGTNQICKRSNLSLGIFRIKLAKCIITWKGTTILETKNYYSTTSEIIVSIPMMITPIIFQLLFTYKMD